MNAPRAAIGKIVSQMVPLVVDDVDTDQIIPARFLKTTGKRGLGAHLFADWNFVRPDGARILLAGENFGCGSSREHAVWALVDAGFAAVVAPSFADIFAANAVKNGLVPVKLAHEVHRRLRDAFARDAATTVTVDVRAGEVTLPKGERAPFSLDAFARRCLADGVDELDFIRSHEAAIAEYEARHA